MCAYQRSDLSTAKFLFILEMLIHRVKRPLRSTKNIVWAVYHDLRDIFIRKDGIQQTAKAAIHFINAVDRIHLLNWEADNLLCFLDPPKEVIAFSNSSSVIRVGCNSPVDGFQDSGAKVFQFLCCHLFLPYRRQIIRG